MKFLRYFLCLLSVSIFFSAAASADSSSVNADWWSVPEISIKTGTITDYGIKMGHGRGEHLAYLDLDETTRWEIKDFDSVSELNWEIGDNIKIYFESGGRLHLAENLDKQNHAFLILIKL